MKMLTTKEAAKVIGCCQRHVALMCRQGKLDCEVKEVGNLRFYFIPESAAKNHKKIHTEWKRVRRK